MKNDDYKNFDLNGKSVSGLSDGVNFYSNFRRTWCLQPFFVNRLIASGGFKFHGMWISFQ